ncbi:hypothetical protein Dimus_027668 [Dionaea muscipula]
MEGDPRKGEGCHNLLDLIPKGSEWLGKRDHNQRSHGSSDEKKLELRLGPPGDEPIWSSNPRKEIDESLLSFCYFSSMTHTDNHHHKNGTPWPCPGFQQQQQQQQQQKQSAKVPFLHQYQTSPGAVAVAKESSQPSCTRMVELHNADKNNTISPAPANTAVANNSSQKRGAPGPVVGWPPLRSFRKNLAGSNTGKTSPEPPGTATKTTANENSVENNRKGMFVKINMDGIPIGRKIDLHAYDTYDKLSIAVAKLFRGLLAAQKDPTSSGNQKKPEEEKPITGLLDGQGEYTLVYEDNEGDRMLVGDVPWRMFVSTVKRLRVLKSSDLPTLNRGGRKQREEGALMDSAAN